MADVLIQLNHHWRAARVDDVEWRIYRRRGNDTYELVYSKLAPRRRIYEIMDDLEIVHTPRAEALLNQLPETADFRRDEDEDVKQG